MGRGGWQHAEFSAILNAKQSLKGATVFVVRVKNSKLKMSKPCEICQKILKEAGVVRAYYYDNSQQISYIDLRR